MSRILFNAKAWLFVLLVGLVSSVWAQSDDFTTWTKFKVNHKIDSRFSVSGGTAHERGYEQDGSLGS